jgi:hypothetical protein
MSMELLKEIDEKFDECYERNLKPSFEWMVGVSERLKKVLTHPDIKPVAWALFSKKIMPSGVAYAVRRVEIELSQIKADLDIQDAEIIPLFMKRDLLASNQSALIEQLRVQGDSMTPDFPHGCIIVVEPELDPLPGDYVIAKNGDDEATFK